MVIDVHKITKITILMNHGDYDHCRIMLVMYVYVFKQNL